jgi:GNAT superfamily N-acetyltransferase
MGSDLAGAGEPDASAAADMHLRPALDADAQAIATVLLRARSAAVAAGNMPAAVHPASDMVRHVREDLLASREVWVAEAPPGGVADSPAPVAEAAEVVAVMSLDDQWLDDLYVAPGHAGQGIGSALLDLAKALRPRGFDLWVFEVNTPARRFYERHGLVELDRTDGSGNDERAPDCRYGWRPSAALSGASPPPV